MRKLLQGETLYRKAEMLGVAIWDVIEGGKRVKVQEAIVQQRVQEAERSIREAVRFRRESRLWIVAVVSAAASVLSAAAAIIAVSSS